MASEHNTTFLPLPIELFSSFMKK